MIGRLRTAGRWAARWIVGAAVVSGCAAAERGSIRAERSVGRDGRPTGQSPGALAQLRSAQLGGAEPRPVEAIAAEEIGLGSGFRLPRFSAVDLGGVRHSLNEYDGQILVLHFWASWCPYCRASMPELIQLHQEGAGTGVRVLAVSTDEDLQKLHTFLFQQPLPYPVIAGIETHPSVLDQYAVSGIPVTYIVARDGRIAFRLNGRADLLKAVQYVIDHPTGPWT